jgi:hypothetical protein
MTKLAKIRAGIESDPEKEKHIRALFRKVDPATDREQRAISMMYEADREARPLDRFTTYETRHIFDEMERFGLQTPRERAIAVHNVKEAVARDAVVERLKQERKRLDMTELSDELRARFEKLEQPGLSADERKEILSWAVDSMRSEVL